MEKKSLTLKKTPSKYITYISLVLRIYKDIIKERYKDIRIGKLAFHLSIVTDPYELSERELLALAVFKYTTLEPNHKLNIDFQKAITKLDYKHKKRYLNEKI